MKKMNLLCLFLMSIFSFNCSNEEVAEVSTPSTAVEFTAVAADAQVTLSWDNTTLLPYDIWRSESDNDFKKIVSGTRRNKFVDNVIDLQNASSLTYRIVSEGGDVNAADVIKKQQVIQLQLASDNELLDEVQKATLKYFYDFAEPNSKWARERSNNPNDLDVVTTGGTGFGIMALVAGAERSFISRDEAFSHIRQITDFMLRAERFHGAFAHWYYGSTGKVKPFSPQDNGGDLVETAFLMQGLLAAKEYFDTPAATTQERRLVNDMQSIWEGVEWDWYTQGQNKLFWHWSKEHGFAMNMPISGWNEGLIVYVLAAASPTHPVAKEVYTNGYAHNGAMKNGRNYYGINLPLGNDPEMGGPLFFAHYSFLGLNPNGLKDEFCDNYFTQNKNHTLINRAYCLDNPKNFPGYGEDFWGLTASDCPVAGYLAHAPGANDNGTITPTAALSSFPYTPQESMQVLKHLYRDLNNQIWGEYGFYDAINLNVPADKQVAKSYLAIDQGPIVVMIENYRSQLLWNLFMKNSDVQKGLKTLGFQSPHIN